MKPDPCSGRDNCVTFVDACEINPSGENLVGTIEATKNFRTSIDIQCNHNMGSGRSRNIFHMSAGGESGNPGDRFFAAWLKPTGNQLYFALGVPNGRAAHYKTLDCVDGEWNTYVLEQRQDPKAPGMVNFNFLLDGIELESLNYASDDVLDNTSVDAFVSREASIDRIAFDFKVRNFFHQSFADVTRDECVNTTNPCDGNASCTTFVDSCAINPSAGNNLGQLRIYKSFRASIDIKCSHEMDGSAGNIFHLSAGGGKLAINNEPGARFFAAWRLPNSHKLHFALGIPIGLPSLSESTGIFAQYKTFDCVDGEWNTYVFEQRQNQEDLQTLTQKFSMDGNELASYNYTSDAFVFDTVVDAFSSREDHPNRIAWKLEVRNFFYQELL